MFGASFRICVGTAGSIPPSVTTKSVVFDIADNWGHADQIGVRAIAFKYLGSFVSLLPADFTGGVSSQETANFDHEDIFDTSLSVTGAATDTNAWRSATPSNNTNQRLVVVFNTLQTFDEIVINNYHSSGASTNLGMKTTTVKISDDVITDYTYNAAVSNSTELVTSYSVPQHSGGDASQLHTIWTAS
jgi:hypothetical protein